MFKEDNSFSLRMKCVNKEIQVGMGDIHCQIYGARRHPQGGMEW